MASARVDAFFGTAFSAVEEFRRMDGSARYGGSRSFWDYGFEFALGGFFDNGFVLKSVRDGNDGLFASGAVVDIDPFLIEPEFDFFVTSLLFGRHLEKVDFNFFAVIEIFDDGVSEFGESARADVAANIFVIFIHQEEDVGAFKILEEGNVDVGEIFGVVAFGGNGTGVIDDFVAATFKITSPVGGAFLELGTSCNDEFFHNDLLILEF